jgi:uncharacterized SAM-binding protein YcdF (DUF218 family)
MGHVSMSASLVQALGATSILLFLVAGFTPGLDLLEGWLNPSRPAEPAQAIVVLGAGGVGEGGSLTDTSLRGAMTGVRLFHQGWAPLLVLSGPPVGPPPTEADLRAELAQQAGVPAAAIVTVSSARTTHEEARDIRTALGPRGVRKILLVVDGPGLTRAMAVFERAGFDVVPAPWSDGWSFGGGPEARLDSLRAIAMELVAQLYYRAAGYL